MFLLLANQDLGDGLMIAMRVEEKPLCSPYDLDDCQATTLKQALEDSQTTTAQEWRRIPPGRRDRVPQGSDGLPRDGDGRCGRDAEHLAACCRLFASSGCTWRCAL
eukprot:COSAG01_NODE_21265_length_910_cov_2.157830_1_plen_105_part_10